MAAFVRLKARSSEVSNDIFQQKREAERYRDHEKLQATKIQSWFRGQRTRSYLRHINQSATVIQRWYRGHVDRKLYRLLLINEMQRKRQEFYNRCATKVQARWRGFYIRSYIFDYYARKTYLNALMIKNELVRKELNEIGQLAIEKIENDKRIKEKEIEILSARKHHFLISTKVSPSIYNSPYNPQSPLAKEIQLKSVSPLSSKEREILAQTKRNKQVQEGVVDLDDDFSPMKNAERPLPPIKTKKLQGPFRNPVDVHRQRYKQLEPTLRVATSFTAESESREKLIANEKLKHATGLKFLPFTRRTYPYEPTLHTKSDYGRPSYGSKHFRPEDTTKHITDKPFKRVVSPIPVFDKLGKTY